MIVGGALLIRYLLERKAEPAPAPSPAPEPPDYVTKAELEQLREQLGELRGKLKRRRRRAPDAPKGGGPGGETEPPDAGE